MARSGIRAQAIKSLPASKSGFASETKASISVSETTRPNALGANADTISLK